MLDTATIAARLREMREQPDRELLWDENCEGSARALVVFVGPSPGSKKTPGRRPLKRRCSAALWDKRFPWGQRYPAFKPLLKAIFSAPYPAAAKLFGRANLDWLRNPNATDVPERFMREGAPSVLRMIEDCAPELILPMEKKAFRVLKDVMDASRFAIAGCEVKEFLVRIGDSAKGKFHRNIHCFRATSPRGHSLVVIKLPQHPARIFEADYATRCGRAVRAAALQIAAGQPVEVTMT